MENSLQTQLESVISNGSSPDEIGRILDRARLNYVDPDPSLIRAIKTSIVRGSVQGVIKLLNFLQDPPLTDVAARAVGSLRGRGSRYILESFLRAFPTYIDSAAVRAAIYPELTGRVSYLIDHGATDYEGILTSAVVGNNIGTLNLLLNRRVQIDMGVVLKAVDTSIERCYARAAQLLLTHFKFTRDELDEFISAVRRKINSTGNRDRCREILRILEMVPPEEEEEEEEEGEEPAAVRLARAIRTNNIQSTISILNLERDLLTNSDLSDALSNAIAYCSPRALELILERYYPSSQEKESLLDQLHSRRCQPGLQQEITQILERLPIT